MSGWIGSPRAPEIHFLLRSSGSEEIDYLIDEVAPNRGVPGVDCGDLRPPMSPSAQSWDWFLEPGGIYSMGTYSGTIAPGSWHHTLMYVRLRAQAVPCVVPLQLESTTAGHTHKRLLAVPIDPPAERPPDPLLGQPKQPSLRAEVKSEWIIRGWNTGAARVATVLVTSNEAASVTITGRLTSLNCTPRGAAWVSSPFMGVEYLQLGTGPINIRPKGWATLTYAFLEVAGRSTDSKCQATVEVASSEYTDERMPATVAEAVIDF